MNYYNADVDNEMSHLFLQGSHIDSMPEEDKQHKDTSSATYPRFGGVLRQFLLGFFTIVFGWCLNWRSNTEYRKVAIYQSRTVAATHSFLHLAPLSGVITLLMLQWTSYFASSTDGDSTMLQFVAKLHELFMQASIIEVIFCLVRTQVVDGFAPLGLLAGTVQATQLSYIWSLDYLSICTLSGFRWWRKVFFAIAMPTLILFISLVGPSSAILMVPRSGAPHERTGFTLYAHKSSEEMYPTTIGPGLNLDITQMNSTVNRFPLDRRYEHLEGNNYTCLSYRTSKPAIISNNGKHQQIQVQDRILRISTANIWVPRPMDSWQYNRVRVSLPSIYGALSFFNHKNGRNYVTNRIDVQPLLKNGTVTVGMSYPVVDVQCGASQAEGSGIPYLKDNGTFDTIPLADSLVTKASKSFKDYREYRYYAPVWIRSPEPGSSSLVGIFINRNATAHKGESLPLPSTLSKTGRTYGDLEDDLDIQFVACKLSASWDYGDVQLEGSPSEQKIKTVSYPTSKSPHARSIALNVTEIDMIHNVLLYDQMETTDVSTIDFGSSGWAIILSVTFALAISAIPEVNLGQTGDYRLQDLHSYPPLNYPINMTTFKFTLTEYGYGYGTRSTPIYLAMAVISTYCVITLLYIIYTITTGSTSTAWNS